MVKQKEAELLKKKRMEAQKSLKVFREGVGKYIDMNVTKS